MKNPNRLIVVACNIGGLLLALSICSKSLAFPRAGDTWQPTQILYANVKKFFGDLRGTFRFNDSKLSFQIAAGLENDQLTGRQISQLPKVGNDLYLESGRTDNYFPLYSAVLITPPEKVVSAALLDGAGLTIFLRPSEENNLYVAVLNKWGSDLWCSRSPVFNGLGNGVMVGQMFDLSDCRPSKIQTIYLSGYGDRSVN